MAIQANSRGAAKQGLFMCPGGSVILVCILMLAGFNDANANEPGAVFSAIHHNVPNIRSVLIIYQRNGPTTPEFINTAVQEGRKYNINVHLEQVDSIFEYAQSYHTAVINSPPDQAILIIQSLPISLLFSVLQTAWDRRIVLVSIIQGYARYGVLLTVSETEVIVNRRMAERLDNR